MKKTYLVDGDHWQENFNCYAVFNEPDSSDLAILSSCFAASEGSGWTKEVSLIDWIKDNEQQSLTLCFGPSGDFSMELTKLDEQVHINLYDALFQLPQKQFAQLCSAWAQIMQKKPVVVELSQSDGTYTFLCSKGQRIAIE